MRRRFLSAKFAVLVVSAAMAAMLFAGRLPPNADFLLPRRGGFWLYRAAWALFSSAAGRNAFSSAIVLLVLASALAFAADARRSVPRVPVTWSGWAGLTVGPIFAAYFGVRFCSRALDVVQLIAFPYGAMDAREPIAAFLLFAAALLPAAAAARAWIAGRRRRASLIFAALIAADLASGLGTAARGVGRPPAPPPAHGKTLYLVMTAGPKGPDHDAYVLSPDIFADPDPAPYYRGLIRPADARAVPALRALYESETKRWHAAGLRSALLLGCARGDVLAPTLLLAHLSAAAPSAEAVAMLGALADEDVWRIGPLGAAAIAHAYAHLGDGAAAARWAAKADGPRGVPPGLLNLAGGGMLNPGRISGTLSAPGRARVALYLKSDPAAPYLLDAAGFVAAADPDARGRFAFSGLTAGRYYLAVAMSADEDLREVSVSGNRGDLILDRVHPSLELPPLTIRPVSR